jgi:hypothetical protein
MWRARVPECPPRAAAAIAALMLALAVPAGSEDAPADFNGLWRAVHGMDELRAQVDEAAGTEKTVGAGVTDKTKETDRVQLRSLMLSELSQAASLEIDQTPTEIKVVHGEAGVRVFYFGRDGVRIAGNGMKLKTRLRWEGHQLVIEETGADGMRLVETYTLVPGGDRMTLALRWESRWLKAPLELALIFERVKAGA